MKKIITILMNRMTDMENRMNSIQRFGDTFTMIREVEVFHPRFKGILYQFNTLEDYIIQKDGDKYLYHIEDKDYPYYSNGDTSFIYDVKEFKYWKKRLFCWKSIKYFYQLTFKIIINNNEITAIYKYHNMKDLMNTLTHLIKIGKFTETNDWKELLFPSSLTSFHIQNLPKLFNAVVKLQRWLKRWLPIRRILRYVHSKEFIEWYYSPPENGKRAFKLNPREKKLKTPSRCF